MIDLHELTETAYGVLLGRILFNAEADSNVPYLDSIGHVTIGREEQKRGQATFFEVWGDGRVIATSIQ